MADERIGRLELRTDASIAENKNQIAQMRSNSNGKLMPIQAEMFNSFDGPISQIEDAHK